MVINGTPVYPVEGEAMKVIKIEIEVAEGGHELSESLRQFVKDTRTALADGWQPGQDIPAILTAAFTRLVPAIRAVEKIGPEASENPRALTKGVANPVIDIVFDIAEDAKDVTPGGSTEV